MMAKYGSIAAANARWRMQFPAWGDVRIPVEGTAPGPIWSDVLLWYRDSKRRMILDQIQHYRAELARNGAGNIPLILFAAGNHVPQSDWAQALQTGTGSYPLKVMTDTEFVIDAAGRLGCWLQDTGAQNEREDQYIVSYMAAHSIRVPLWAESVGSSVVNPLQLARAVMRFGMFGMEYVSAPFLFEPDGVSPNPLFGSFRAACAELTGFYGGGAGTPR